MLIFGGSVSILWSNPLVGAIAGLAMTMLFWPVISAAFGRTLRSIRRPVVA
jgi:putative tricarboxylic transport membrane protein